MPVTVSQHRSHSCKYPGRLTRDPDVRYTTSSEPVCIARFTLAVEDRERGQYHSTAPIPVNILYSCNALPI